MAPLNAFIDQFREIQPKFTRLFTRMLAQADLTQPQYALLLELTLAAPVPMTMTAISGKLFISKPAVTSLVDRLEKKGCLKRLNDPDDRRVSLLQIQPKGKNTAEKMRARILDLIRDAAKPFNGSERDTIQKFYSVLSNNLDEVLNSPKEKQS